MKRLLPLLLLVLSAVSATAQTPSCCVRKDGIMALASTAAFQKAHEAPEPFLYDEKRGSDMTFNTPDGKTGSAYYVPGPGAVRGVLILFHEWWGLNDYIRREADRWQDSLGTVDVYAIDLYDGKVATAPEQASAFAGALDKRRTDAIIQGLLTKIGRDPQIATLGWCLGGSYAFRCAVLADKRAAGCVMYYGFPEENGKNITPLKTDVLYLWASRDKFITRDKVDAFAAAVRTTGRKITVESYDADHAFANPSNPHFDAAAAAAAQQKALPFLRRMLGLD